VESGIVLPQLTGATENLILSFPEDHPSSPAPKPSAEREVYIGTEPKKS
jgi:hypothetical protein